MSNKKTARALPSARATLAGAEPFDEHEIEQALRPVIEELGSKPGAVFQPLRIALTKKRVSAGIFESAALLGREEALARIDAALKRLEQENDAA